MLVELARAKTIKPADVTGQQSTCTHVLRDARAFYSVASPSCLMRLLIAGGSGFIGKRLTAHFLAQGHSVTVLTRNSKKPIKHVDYVQWDGENVGDWVQHLPSSDVLINLCGSSLAERRWSEVRKHQLLQSRLQPTNALVRAMLQLAEVSRPRLYIQTSGVGYYGPVAGTQEVFESDPPSNDFLARLAKDWEEASAGFEPLGIRRVIMRLGAVLDRKEGLLPNISIPLLFLVGGPMGSGKQYMPWIHYEDVVGAVDHFIANDRLSGPFNVCAPNYYTNAQFIAELAKVLHRPSWLRLPAWLYRLTMGQMATLLLEGQCASPRKLIDSGFEFKFPRLPEALRDLYS